MNAVKEAPAKPSFVVAKRSTDVGLQTYAAVAKEVGVEVPQIIVEDFLAILEKKQYPIYNRREVVSYMDAHAATGGKGFGWEWKPIRHKDKALTKKLTFGKPSEKVWTDEKGEDIDDGSSLSLSVLMFRTNRAPHRIIPASDYYNGEQSKVYERTLPLHALQRIASIERDYQGPLCFLVSDYATEPHILPDPFLMALLPNVPVDQGTFVIDVWDEPGFGIASMLK